MSRSRFSTSSAMAAEPGSASLRSSTMPSDARYPCRSATSTTQPPSDDEVPSLTVVLGIGVGEGDGEGEGADGEAAGPLPAGPAGRAPAAVGAPAAGLLAGAPPGVAADWVGDVP